jgi:hypothetical protein
MHLQAAEDLREEAARVKREARERAAGGEDAAMDGKPESKVDVEGTLRLAEILGNGGLPKIARLDVRFLPFLLHVVPY